MKNDMNDRQVVTGPSEAPLSNRLSSAELTCGSPVNQDTQAQSLATEGSTSHRKHEDARLPESPLEFLRRANQGEFGNTFRMWESLADVIKEDYTGRLWVPNRQPGLPPYSLSTPLDRLPHGLDRDYYFVELPSDNVTRLCQFRLGHSPQHGNVLEYDESQHPLRFVVKQNLWVERIYGFYEPFWFLKRRLEPEDYTMLCDLFRRFPEAIVEATNWSRGVGRLQRRLCLWEVRGGKY